MDIRVHRVGDFDTTALGAAVKVLEDRSESGVSPGLSYSLFDAGGIIAAGGYGDSGPHAAPGADTAFRIASCTKSFTTATALPTPSSSVPTVRWGSGEEFVMAWFVLFERVFVLSIRRVAGRAGPGFRRLSGVFAAAGVLSSQELLCLVF